MTDDYIDRLIAVAEEEWYWQEECDYRAEVDVEDDYDDDYFRG